MPRKRKAQAADAENKKLTSLILVVHLPVECWKPVASFCTVDSLAALDATAKMFAEVTDAAWAARTEERFGPLVKNPDQRRLYSHVEQQQQHRAGKMAWRRGVSFSRGQAQHGRFFFKLKDPADVELRGAPRMCACSTFIAISSEDGEDENRDDFFSTIVIRDINTLRVVRMIESPISTLNVAICGPVRQESIIVSNCLRVRAIHPIGFIAMTYKHLNFYGDVENNKDVEELKMRLSVRSENGIPIIGNDQHLLVYRGGRLFVFQIQQINYNRVLCLQSVKDFVPVNRLGRINDSHMAWASSSAQGTGILVLVPEMGEICVCRLHPQPCHVQVLESAGSPMQQELPSYATVAVGQNYFAACIESTKRIHIFDRTTCRQIHSLYDGVSERESEGSVHPAQLHIIGDLLFATSALGNALVLWDMKTGNMMFRGEEAFEQRLSNQLDRHGNDATAMVCVEQEDYTVLITHAYCETAWAFATSSQGQHELSAYPIRTSGVNHRHNGIEV